MTIFNDMIQHSTNLNVSSKGSWWFDPTQQKKYTFLIAADLTINHPDMDPETAIDKATKLVNSYYINKIQKSTRQEN